MRLTNRHMEENLREFIEKILEEGRATTREKAQERMRAQLAPQQKKLGDLPTKKVSEKKARAMKRDALYAQGTEVSAPSLYDDEDPDLAAHDPDRRD